MLSKTITTRIAPSKIEGAGVGLFAVVPIQKWQKLYISDQVSKELIDAKEFETLEDAQKTLILERFPIFEETGFMHPHSDYLLSFVNHSKDGNYSPVYDIALRDIEVGEEITFDYGNYAPHTSR